jgi:hypothetical protein
MDEALDSGPEGKDEDKISVFGEKKMESHNPRSFFI